VDTKLPTEHNEEGDMSMEKIYSCDICRDRIKNPNLSFGVNFSNMKEFTLGGNGCTEGVHICYSCARQLIEHLNHVQIMKLLEE
jgi:hypothetical protein